MSSQVDVSFCGVPENPFVEASIHRWVARLEDRQIEVQRALIILEPSGRHRTLVSVTLLLTNGVVQTTAKVHADAYLGIANAFRDARRQLRSD